MMRRSPSWKSPLLECRVSGISWPLSQQIRSVFSYHRYQYHRKLALRPVSTGFVPARAPAMAGRRLRTREFHCGAGNIRKHVRGCLSIVTSLSRSGTAGGSGIGRRTAQLLDKERPGGYRGNMKSCAETVGWRNLYSLMLLEVWKCSRLRSRQLSAPLL